VGPGGAAPGRSSAVSVFDGQWKHEFKAFHSLYLSLLLIASTSHSGTQPEPSYDVLLQQGNEQSQAGRADQALDSAEAATKIRPDRWEGYALEGGALLKMKRYEEAADALSKAIDRAPDSNQHALRELRRQCLLAESGYPVPTKSSGPIGPSDAQTAVLAPNRSTAAKARTEDDPQQLADKLTWVEPETDLMWARNSRLAEYAHANFTRATRYCASLRTLGYTDWRLPTTAEFLRIYHFATASATVHLDGGLATNEDILSLMGFWTSTPGDKDGEHVLVFEGKSVSSRDTDGEGRVGGWFAGHPWNGAIVCVRSHAS
jgi:tetratricopeptide (TPR) repeat protein